MSNPEAPESPPPPPGPDRVLQGLSLGLAFVTGSFAMALYLTGRDLDPPENLPPVPAHHKARQKITDVDILSYIGMPDGTRIAAHTAYCKGLTRIDQTVKPDYELHEKTGIWRFKTHVRQTPNGCYRPKARPKPDEFVSPHSVKIA